MISILLVDDEPLMRVALNSIIDWNENGFEVCATASNGIEALELIELYSPDIVITDLKMPKMDGIDLIKNIFERDYHCKVLVISNYSDYDLVREALTLGAKDYLLKINMQPNELLCQLNKLKRIVEEEYAVALQDGKKMIIDENIKKTVLRDFFCNAPIGIDTITKHAELDFSHQNDNSFLCYITPDLSDGMEQIDLSSLENIIFETLGRAAKVEAFPIYPNELVTIISITSLSLKEVVVKINKALNTYVTTRQTISYSNSFTGYEAAKIKYELCKSALEIRFYSSELTIHADDIKFQHYLNFTDYRSFTTELIQRCTNNGHYFAMQRFTEFFDICKKKTVHPEIALQYVFKVLEYISMNKSDLGEKQHELLNSTNEQVLHCHKIEELIRLVGNLLPIVFPASNLKAEVEIVINYVNENYSKKISLASAVAQVHLNESYLCRIFKEETGKSIVNYINSVRMEKAAQLLKLNTPISDICHSIGIENEPYFYRLFKNYYGVSPAKFHKEM